MIERSFSADTLDLKDKSTKGILPVQVIAVLFFYIRRITSIREISD